MRMSSRWARRQIANGLIVLLAVPLAGAAPATPPHAGCRPETQCTSVVEARAQNTNGQVKKQDSNTIQPEILIPDAPDPVRLEGGDQNGQTGTPQSDSNQQQNDFPKPVGTAAAPYQKTTGVAASRPAGAVIAPAKQHRARTILIRISLVVGAAVAVGTVVALSRESPSRP
jgi:hypothetical protein